MIHANFFFDDSLLDCHIKKQNNTVKEVELDEIDKEIINSSKQELTLLDKADLLKRIFDYPYREITNNQSPSYHFVSTTEIPEQPKEERHYTNLSFSITDEKIINKTLNQSYLTLKNKVLKNRCFRQNLINLKRRTQQLLNSGSGDSNVMDKEQFQSKVDAAIRNETEKGRVRCPFCPRRCFLKENMRAHLATSHHGDLPYTCNQCDQRFSTKEQLVSHHRIHLEAKPFRCTLCDKGFTQLGNLQRHHKIHERAAAAAAAAVAATTNATSIITISNSTSIISNSSTTANSNSNSSVSSTSTNNNTITNNNNNNNTAASTSSSTTSSSRSLSGSC